MSTILSRQLESFNFHRGFDSHGAATLLHDSKRAAQFTAEDAFDIGLEGTLHFTNSVPNLISRFRSPMWNGSSVSSFSIEFVPWSTERTWTIDGWRTQRFGTANFEFSETPDWFLHFPSSNQSPRASSQKLQVAQIRVFDPMFEFLESMFIMWMIACVVVCCIIQQWNFRISFASWIWRRPSGTGWRTCRNPDCLWQEISLSSDVSTIK